MIMNYNKQYFRQLMLDILNPLKSLYSPGCAGINIGHTNAHYDVKAARMEAFSRPLWGLTAFWAGGGKENEGKEDGPDFAIIYRKGLTSGTNPDSPEYWGECGAFDQRFVEMAAISYGLMYARSTVWDPLDDRSKANLAAYLNKINEHPLPVCNWILFAVLVNIALKKVGYPYDAELLERYLNGLEDFYIGDGWYRDGDSNQKDYYISFAIHFYCLIYADRMAEDDPARAQRYRERAMLFAKQFIYWFDKDGGAIPFGRSLTYRFAQVSFFSACLITGLEPFPVPVLKGLIVRHMENWLKQPIFDRDGLLTIGYGYPNLIMAERYNAFGSPYWCMKTFGILMLPDDHPFWSAECAPLPKLEPVCPMPCADMLVRHYGNHTTAFVPGVYSPYGHGQIVAKYSKFAYDTRCGICVAKSSYELHENAPDSMLAFFIDGYVYVRRICEKSQIEKDRVISEWSPYPGIHVTTTIIPNAEGHTRIHHIESSVECDAWDCGFSVNRGDFDYESIGYESSVNGSSATASNRKWSCSVVSADSNSSLLRPEGYMLIPDPNLNIIFPKAAIPSVKYHISKGTSDITTEVFLKV